MGAEGDVQIVSCLASSPAPRPSCPWTRRISRRVTMEGRCAQARHCLGRSWGSSHRVEAPCGAVQTVAIVRGHRARIVSVFSQSR